MSTPEDRYFRGWAILMLVAGALTIAASWSLPHLAS